MQTRVNWGFFAGAEKTLDSHRFCRLFYCWTRRVEPLAGSFVCFPIPYFYGAGKVDISASSAEYFMIVHKKFGFACGCRGFVRESGANPSSSFFVLRSQAELLADKSRKAHIPAHFIDFGALFVAQNNCKLRPTPSCCTFRASSAFACSAPSSLFLFGFHFIFPFVLSLK